MEGSFGPAAEILINYHVARNANALRARHRDALGDRTEHRRHALRARPVGVSPESWRS